MKCVLLVTKSETVLTFRQCLIRHLLDAGHSVHVIAYDDDCRREIKALGVDFTSVRQENRWLNPFAIIRYARQVRTLLQQLQPDLVVTFQLKPNTFGVLSAKHAQIRQIFSVVEGAGDVFIQNGIRWKLIRFVACRLYRQAFRHSRKVFFLNEEDKQEFVCRQLVAEEKCRVIPGVGVDLVRFSETPVTGHRSFLMLARMLKTKGVEDYCQCARLVRQKYPDAQFLYLGAEGTVRVADIQSYIDDGSVCYLGTTRDVRPYLRDCTALLLPSYREGLPMAVMEAAASGRCSIVTDAIGCKDAVKDGETGFLVPVGDAKAMAEKCIYLIEHPEAARTMGAAARQFAQETFDEKTINSYLLQELGREVASVKKAMLLANDTTYVYNLRRELVQRLVQEGYQVAAVSEPLLHQEALQEMGCRLVPVSTGRHGTNPFADLALFFKYFGILRREKPDVVFSYNIKPNVYGGLACRLLGIRYMPNITGLGTAVEYPGLMQKLTTRLYKMGVAGAECVFFQNEENRQFFVDRKMLGKRSRTHLLPGSGVNLQINSPLPYPNHDTVNFLFTARVMKEKGIDLYLDAAKAIGEKYENVLFHICGRCDDEAYIEILRQAEQSGKVKYHGEQKNMRAFVELADCIVHPSYYPEGMSNVLLEGAAGARPLIATDRSGCREIVDDGITGYVIPCRQLQPLIDAIETFLALPHDAREAMGKAGRAKVEREFDRQIVVNAYMEELQKG